MARPAPLLLCIRDGWGVAPAGPGNAVSLARTPVLDRLLRTCPTSLIEASGAAVGLPPGQMGNSEVGHMNIGAGRVVYQDLTRIDQAIETGSFATNKVLREALAQPRCHLLGLVSDGGVHSHQRHLDALLELAAEVGCGQLWVHAILDGRDTPPQSGADYLQQLLQSMGKRGGRLATISGRYYAMDRDNRWDRVERACRAFCQAEGEDGSDPIAAVRASYARDVGDEFVLPLVVDPTGCIQPGDSLLFFNFRADRMRQLVKALHAPDFDGFARGFEPCARAASLTRYDETFDLPVAYAPQSFSDIMPEIIAAQGWPQLRIAETEKFAHVTYFTSCGREQPFDGEERILIPSPRVATYDLTPKMSAEPVTEKLLAAIRSRTYPLMILNYANADMVGHTGKMDASIEAVETIDRLLGQALGALDEVGGQALITADHGNIEKLLDAQGQPHTAHTTNPVHLIWFHSQPDTRSLANGRLCDIAPSILELFGLAKPAAMDGRSLLV